ncbi:hypothetical protein BDN70DRAFT_706437 [Pholiota conissans]|uniref:LIM zinc-binding domain-containing protein n=1 Tax=Pholiota conissans TaxID=109636 RepID=A0A9P6D6V1_9AGAR|nr:hypothetical protein BDN70DRAFT_706437 [Pholiota conissans]
MYEDEEEEEDDASIRLAYEDEEDEEEYEDEEERWETTPRRRQDANGSRNVVSGPGRRHPEEAQGYEYDDELEDVRRRRPATAGAERQRGPDYAYRAGNTGLPQPPSMIRQNFSAGGTSARNTPEKHVRGTQRLTSAPLKYDDSEDTHNRYPVRGAQQDVSAMQAKFTSMNVSNVGGSGQVHGRSQSSGGAWPVDLPRLPRTPGSGNTPGAVGDDAGGYFDSKPHSAAIPGSNFTRSRSNTNLSAKFPLPPSHPSLNNAFHNNRPPQTPSRANLNLDDPPPRASIVRTPSPGPSGGYVLTPRRELPQPQGAPQDRGHPDDQARVNADLARRRSLYSAASNVNQRQQQVGSPQKRPQSQVYGSFDEVQQQPQHQQFHSHQQQQQQQQQPAHQHQHPHQQPHFSNHLGGGNHSHPTNSRPQQTPAPPPPVGIESPHPIGGREKMADIPKLEEDSNDGSDNEHQRTPRRGPMIQVDTAPRAPSIPMINVSGSSSMDNNNVPSININGGGGSGGLPMINVDPPMIHVDASNGNSPRKQVFEIPGVSVSAPQFDDHHGPPRFSVSGPDDHSQSAPQRGHGQQQHQQQQGSSSQSQFAPHRTGGLICGGCHGPIIGRIVSAMGQRFHPSCFKCTVCDELLEHVSSYEHEGRPYCHLDYHENFAPRCYSCKTAIIEEQFISLDDPALGKRAYHTQHFFCSECGDPFLTPSGGLPTNSNGEMAVTGDGEFEGFTVYKGYPYCEACHVRLRLPKCKRCKRSIRDNDQAVEALGGKWCWSCFVCANCEKPFEDPSFFQRGDQPYCENCFSIMLRNEI